MKKHYSLLNLTWALSVKQRSLPYSTDYEVSNEES